MKYLAIGLLLLCATPAFSQEAYLRAILVSIQAINTRLDRMEARIEAVACKCDKSVVLQSPQAAPSVSQPVYYEATTFQESAPASQSGRFGIFRGRRAGRGGGCSGGG